MSKYGAPTRTRHSLKVLNLSSRISWQDLKDLLRKAGEVCFAEAHTERSNEGRVELATAEDLERVVKRYQGYDLNGRKMELVREHSRSRSRSRRRSRSRSRSKSRRDSRSRSRRRSRSRSRQDSRARSRKSKSRQDSRSRSRSRSRSKSANSQVDPEDQDVKRQRKRSHSRGSNYQPSPGRKVQDSEQREETRKDDD